MTEEMVKRSPLRKINIVNPMLAFGVSEDQIIEEISTLGWRKTNDTGSNSTNCLLNDLGIAVHYKQHQYNPYVNEIAEQVRTGLMSREEAIHKVQDIPDFSRVALAGTFSLADRQCTIQISPIQRFADYGPEFEGVHLQVLSDDQPLTLFDLNPRLVPVLCYQLWGELCAAVQSAPAPTKLKSPSPTMPIGNRPCSRCAKAPPTDAGVS